MTGQVDVKARYFLAMEGYKDGWGREGNKSNRRFHRKEERKENRATFTLCESQFE